MNTLEPANLEVIVKLTKDLRQAAVTLSQHEARYLVDMYYTVQAQRIRSAAQVREATDQGEPNQMLQWAFDNFKITENGVRSALLVYAQSKVVGDWMLSIHGIGPVLAAGFLAHIDIKKAPTVGHIWSFAGLNPGVQWIGKAGALSLATKVLGKGKLKITREHIEACAEEVGRNPDNLENLAKTKTGNITRASLTAALAKRPWNDELKTLCWKTGQCFMKLRGNKEKDVYGKVYEARKTFEIERNDSGGNAEAAQLLLETKKYKQNETREHLEAGHLPPGQIDARARRYAVKLFLAHLHHVMYEDHYGEAPPKPYALSHLDHAHFIAPPQWDSTRILKKTG